MFFRGKAKNEEVEFPTNAKDSLHDIDSWSNMVDDAQNPSLCHLCVPSCNRPNSFCGKSDDCCSFLFSAKDVVLGHAFDMIMIQSDSDPSSIACTDVVFSFDPLSAIPNCFLNLKTARVYLELEDVKGHFPLVNGSLRMPQYFGDEEEGGSRTYKHSIMDRHDETDPLQRHNKSVLIDDADQSAPFIRTGKHDPRALAILADRCPAPSTQNSATAARIAVRSANGDQRLLAVAPCFIHFWSSSDRILVCDIDGTITKSNIKGLIDTVVTQQYKFCHEGVCNFLRSVLNEQKQQQIDQIQHPTTIRILYLTSRPLGLAFSTRRFLQKLRQPDGTTVLPSTSGSSSSRRSTTVTGIATMNLPPGPLLGFTQGLWRILLMELVTHSVHEFKSQTLQNITHLWKTVAATAEDARDIGSPFWAGLGNTFMDAQAYHEAGMDLNQIYIINKQSEIRCLDRQKISARASGKDYYKEAQRTVFPRGYLDNNIVAHVLSASSRRKTKENHPSSASLS